MNLLFSRSQMRASFLSFIPLRIGGTVTFKLKAELELTPKELALARRYSFTKATLIRSDTGADLANAFRPALLLSILLAFAVAVLVPSSAFGFGTEGTIRKIAAVPALGFVSFVVLVFLYFFSLRKHVSVDQLMNGGRMFYCHSVVELDEREAEILDFCKRFYLTLEKAKNWGGREINPLPDGEPHYLENRDGDHHRVGIDRAMHKAGQSVSKLAEPFRVSRSEGGYEGPPKSFFEKVKDVLFEPEDTNGASSRQSHTPPTKQTKPRDPNAPLSSSDHPLHGLMGGSGGTGWGDGKPPAGGAGQQSSAKPSPPKPPSKPSEPNSSSQQSSHPFAPKPPDDGPSGSSD